MLTLILLAPDKFWYKLSTMQAAFSADSSSKKPSSFKLNLTFWIFVALFIGILLGRFFPSFSSYYQMGSKLFVRLIKMIVAPLVFSSLVVGLCGAGSKHVGRLLGKSLLWFWVATAVALAIGLGTANLLKPGQGAVKDPKATYEAPKEPPRPFIEQVVPESIVNALANNSLLQIVFFSLLFGLALAAIGEKGKPVVDVLQSVSETMFKVTEYVMYVVPIGVGGAMAYTVSRYGLTVLVNLAKLVGSLYLALFVFVLLLLIIVKVTTRVRIINILKEIRDSLLVAFSTASSESVLPKVMQSMEKLGVPSRIVRLVIPTGYSFNLDGTTLYLSLAAIFIAQASGKSFSPWQQIVMMVSLLITSKGVAAVPRASLVVLASTCSDFGLPVEWIGTILGVDALMDMARTSVNVMGNCMASVVVGHWENALPKHSPLYQKEAA